MRRAALACSIAAACTATSPPSPTSRTAVYLTPTEHLVRASMALRGIRPSLDELTAVATDPGKLAPLVDAYLQSPEFGATVRELHNEALLLRVQRPEFTPTPLWPLDKVSYGQLSRSYFEEPLRLIENVVMTDQPYTQIVTADYTMADPVVATMYGMAYGGAGGWEQVSWPDGRPAAGILASDAIPVRYRSAGANFHRGRANAIARGLLCHDFLDGDVQLDPTVNLADPAVVANAVVEDASCAACHQTLDPLASYYFPWEQGPIRLDRFAAYPATFYDATKATGWFLTTNRPPRYFGKDAYGLDGLGAAIAADPRFARCAAIHFASYLTEMHANDLPPEWVAELQQVLVSSGYNAKALARAIVLSDRFREGAEQDPTLADSLVGYQKARPAQLARMLKALTGYTWAGQSDAWIYNKWIQGDVDYLDDDEGGFRVLAGGIDSFFVTQPVHTVTATSSMVYRLAAYRAATFVVDHDLSAPVDQRTLFTAADVTATDEASVRAELALLHARIYGELDADTDASYALFSGALAADGDARRAWIVTLTGMLSDLQAVYF